IGKTDGPAEAVPRPSVSMRGDRTRLEDQLHCELDAARPAAAQDGVANTGIRRGDDGERLASRKPSCGRTAGSRSAAHGVGAEIVEGGRLQRVREVGVIQQIKGIGAQLKAVAFGDARVLHDGEIPLAERGALQRVASLGAEMAGAGEAINRCGAAGAVQSAGNGKRAYVEELARVAVVVMEWAGEVHPAEILAGAVVVIV